MISNINIQVDASPLKREDWSFVVIERSNMIDVQLDSYTLLERPSLKHKFKISKQWERLYRRHNIGLTKPPQVPQELKDRAVERVRAMVCFVEG